MLAVLVSACGKAPHDDIRFGLPVAPLTLDPRYATDATSYRLCRLIFEALVDFDPQFNAVPALAHWDRLSPTRYRFYLPRGHRFHDGQELTAADVVATYTTILDPGYASPQRGSLANLSRVRAHGEYEVDFELAQPDPLLPGQLTIGILPARRTQTRQATLEPPIGSGPFSIDGPPSAKRISLIRRADQQRFSFEVVPNETVRALKLVRGELDMAQGGFAPELTHWLAQQPGITVTRGLGTGYSYLGLNLTSGPTRNREVRLAIAQAIDRKAIIHHLFRDQARLAHGILVPTHWASDPEAITPGYDPAAARRLLAQLGYDPQHPLSLSYKTSSDQFRLRLATVIQDQLAQAGIKVNIQSYDWGTFYADIKRARFELYGLSWVGLQLPDIFRYAFHSRSVPPVGANRGGYASAKVDELLAAAEATEDLATRAGYYRAIQQALNHDLPYISLWYEDTITVTRNEITGYTTDSNGNLDALMHTDREPPHD